MSFTVVPSAFGQYGNIFRIRFSNGELLLGSVKVFITSDLFLAYVTDKLLVTRRMT
jgi:hypothetical protein